MEQFSMQQFFKIIPEVKALKFPFDEGMFLNINKRKDLNISLLEMGTTPFSLRKRAVFP